MTLSLGLAQLTRRSTYFWSQFLKQVMKKVVKLLPFYVTVV